MKCFLERFLIVPVACVCFCFMPRVNADDQSVDEGQGAISSCQAMLELARMLSYDQAKLGEAAEMYERLLELNPNDQKLLIEAVSVYSRLGNQQRCDELLERVVPETAKSSELLLMRMRRAAALGRAVEARGYCRSLIESVAPDDEIRAEIAGTVQMWGDFRFAENICRQRIAESSEKESWLFLLAGILTGAQRFYGAEAVYERILFDHPGDARALYGLADNFYKSKNYLAALEICDNVLALSVKSGFYDKMLLLKAEILVALQDYDQALHEWTAISVVPEMRVRGLLGMGGTLLETGDRQKAKTCFETVLDEAPGTVDSLFFFHDIQSGIGITPEEFAANYALDSMKMVRAAQLSAEWLDLEQAEKFYHLALNEDNENIIAKRGLAMTLAAQQKYHEALVLYHEMTADFPESYAFGVELARLYAWSHNYEKSLDLYEKLRETNPENSVMLLESARVAGWSKQFERSMGFYKQLFTPSVDSMLAENLRQHGVSEKLTAAFGRDVDEAPPFENYERLWNTFFEDPELVETNESVAVIKILLDLREHFLTQKAAWLEYGAKQALRDMRFRETLVFQNELLAFQPGNEEIIFDRSQTLLQLGRTREAHDSYLELLSLSPLHSLAAMVVKRSEIQARPGVVGGFEMWREKGHDEIADIRWYRMDLGFEIPVMMQNKIRALGHRWIYDAGSLENEAALGLSLYLDVSLSTAISISGGWSGKKGETDEISNTDSFSVSGKWVGPKGVLFKTGFEKRDVVQNQAGLADGTQSKDVWAEFSATPIRKLFVSCSARRMDYSDDNTGVYLASSGGYSITDHPKILNLSAHYSYRDTDSINKYADTNGAVPDQDHFYWTPENYSAWSLMLAFYHDLSPILIAGTDRHMYNVKLSAGNDTEDNPMIRAEGEWRFEFALRAFTALNVMVHRSQDWNAEQAVFSIGCRF